MSYTKSEMKGFNYIKFDFQGPSGETFEPFFNLSYQSEVRNHLSKPFIIYAQVGRFTMKKVLVSIKIEIAKKRA